MPVQVVHSLHAAKWMRENLEIIGNDSISQVLQLPGSHDAGMWTSGGTTEAASDKHTLTQVVSIYEQLKLGIRWFDVRPVYREGASLIPHFNWYCGHYTDTGTLGWQGGWGQSIQDVLSDVKRFMAEQGELVVLRLSHVSMARDGSDVPLGMQKLLLELCQQQLAEWLWQPPSNAITEVALKIKLQNIVDVPAGSMKAVLNVQDFKLKDFLKPDSKGCVVISSTLSDFVYRDTQIIKLCFELSPNGVTVMQQDRDAILTSPLIKNVSWFGGLIVGGIVNALWDNLVDQFGVLGLCKIYLPIEMRAAPAKIMIDHWATPVDTDMIQDDQCLTLALAGSFARLMMKYPDRFDPPVVAVYGGRQVTDKTKLRSIYEAAKNKSTFLVNNDTVGPDPWQGLRKSCVVYYLTENNKMTIGKYCVGRFALENESMDFSGEFLYGSFNGQELKDGRWRTAYWSFERALKNKTPWPITMQNLGYNPADDPLPMLPKKAIVAVTKGAGPELRSTHREVVVGNMVDAAKLLEFAQEDVGIF